MNSELECAIQAYWEASSNGLKGINPELSAGTLAELGGVTFNEHLALAAEETLVLMVAEKIKRMEEKLFSIIAEGERA